MKVKSKEITYRIVIEQVFFDDDSELIIKTGWVEGNTGDQDDVDLQWQTGRPDWADELTYQELLDLVDKGGK
jgi:hypothetical protein